MDGDRAARLQALREAKKRKLNSDQTHVERKENDEPKEVSHSLFAACIMRFKIGW